MKYFCGLLLAGFIMSCGGDPVDEKNEENRADTADNAIVEYNLNNDRLSAVEYNNEISLIQQNVYDQINTLFLSDASSIKRNYDNAVFEIQLKSTDLENMETPDGGADLKKALSNLLDFYDNELNNGFLDVLPLIEIEPENRSREQEYRINDYDEQFAIKEVEYFEAIAEEQNQFAADNNFKISDL